MLFKRRTLSASSVMAPIEPNDTGQSYRVALWTARILAVIASAEALAIVFLAGVIVSLFPLKEVVPMVLTADDKRNQIVRVEPFEIGTRGFDLIAESMGRKYVELRETIDLQTEVRRWQEVAWLTDPEVFDHFRKLMGRENKESPFERMKAERITRTVNIAAFNLLYPPHATDKNEAAATYQVEWDAIDYRQGQEIERRTWVSTMSVKFHETAVRAENRFMNPIGFTVAGYSVGRKETK